MSTHPILLSRVTIDASNNAIRFDEGGAQQTVTIAVGDYAISPNAIDALDLLAAIKTALESHAGTNTYSVTSSWSADSTANGCTISIARATGTNTFAILFANVSTTFDAAAIGFTKVDTASDALTKISTLVPSSVWVSDQPYKSFEPILDVESYVTRAVSGQVRGGLLGGPYRQRMLALGFTCKRRSFAAEYSGGALTSSITGYVGGLMEFVSRIASNIPVLIYFVPVSGVSLSSPSTTTAEGACWWLTTQQSSQHQQPQRLQPGVDLYSTSITFHAVTP